ncbi:hypothetical protein I541_5706 [Mycobacteroides abscessus]|nr:hypothetical protein I541_5706 [Mycobacteroides abscessus]
MRAYSQLFGPNVAGTAEIIKLAISERLKAGHLPVDGGASPTRFR